MTFQKGKSGNPGGRPKIDEEFKKACQAYSEEALEVLLFWMRSTDEKTAGASIKAAQTIIERGHGKPHQSVEVSGKKDAPPIAVMNVVSRPKR